MTHGTGLSFGSKGIGPRIKAIRKQRGLTQSGLAQRAHVSYSTLTKVESGHLPASPAVTAALARALRVPATELTGQPFIRQLRSEQLEELIQPLRIAIANPFHVVDPETEPRTLRALSAEVAQLEELRLSGQGEIGSRLPAIIEELIHAAHMAPAGRKRERAYWLLASAYRLAYTFTQKLGYTDLGMTALERLEVAGSRSGDPCLAGTVSACRSVFFLHSGAHDLGLADVRRVQTQLEESAVRGERRAIYMMGHMHLKAAVLHARKGTVGAAAAATGHVQAACEYADRLPPGFDPYGMIFDSTNVELHNVSIHADLGNFGTAVEEGEKVAFPHAWAKNREAHHHMDMASSYERLGKRKKALSSLLQARSAEAVQTRYHPTTRETVLALLRVRGTPSPELHSYARWVGAA
ncbi:helix-turn-helix transcriptional regulator [Streptomyces sp. NPDC048290]|uniref:helix-turn-helix domain-containing protein n=1 Tax=Streptomyces sp. NPDC048290 TaxID=3155811 RepID=UPI003449B5D5